jgi:aspartate-semialdehyde dehydrogenase
MAARSVNLAVLGATGAVGRALLQALEEDELEIGSLRLLASEHGGGAELDFRGELRRVEVVGEGAFDGVDLAFFAATAGASRAWAERSRAAGCVVVDLSPAFRGDPDVPLVVPELNAQALSGFRTRGLVATPSAAAVQLALVLGPIHAAADIERVVVASCEAVSGAGQPGIEQLERETRAMLNFQEPPPPTVLPHRLAFNLLPQVGPMASDGVTEEERGLVLETRRLLGERPPRITATALRVPLFYGHSQMVNLGTARALTARDARALLAQAPGVKVVDAPSEGVYPMPMLAVNDDAVLVGRIRDDPTQPHGLDLFITGDNLRRGAATTALGVAKLLLERHVTSH